MGSNRRLEARSYVFLGASLHTGAKAIPVRVRNLSKRGAMLDGPNLPAAGSRVRLMRAGLSATASIYWAGKNLAGIRFDSLIDVEPWVQSIVHAGQQRVDQTIATLRSAGKLPDKQSDVDERLSLPMISEMLDQICESLASAPTMTVEFGEELVKLDTLAQSLRRLATGGAF